MIISNLTSKTLVTNKCKFASSITDKAFGLLKKSNHNSLLIKTRFGIHTFGLKKPLDILILDKEYKIRKAKINLNPNRIYLWNPIYPWVLELPTNTIKSSKSKVGDKLKIKFDNA